MLTCCDTRYWICSAVPPEVAFEIAQAASFLISKSAVASSWTSGGMRPQSITFWIWSLLPAVMLEMVQQASLRMLFLWLLSKRSRQGNAPQLMTICVCRSSPVTMLPTVRSAGVWTLGEGCPSSSTSRRTTPASITAWILSFVPSDRYESAQHASVSTSSSFEKIRWARHGSAGLTMWNGGCGLPRQKFDSVHVALRSIDTLDDSVSWPSSGMSACVCSTKSRQRGESPAMLPSAHTACSRTSSFGLLSSCTKIGTAPLSITCAVWSAVPEAMFVRAHAASNCSCGFACAVRNSTKRGTTPDWITSSIGGLRSMESSFLNHVTPWSWASPSGELMACTFSGRARSFSAMSGLAGAGASPPTCTGVPTAALPAASGAAGAAPCVRLFARRASSRFSLRTTMRVSSRLRRLSSESMPFLKFFLRSLPRPDIRGDAPLPAPDGHYS